MLAEEWSKPPAVAAVLLRGLKQTRVPSVRAVVVGSINVDHVVSVARLPIAGETVVGQEYVSFPGGKGLNQAVTAARQGVSTAMVACVGSDADGEMLTSVLAETGIDTHSVRRVENVRSGIALITVASGGGNTIVVVGGANELLEPADVLKASAVIAQASVLLTQLEVPPETVRSALLVGRDAGAITILNPAPVSDGMDLELLKLVDVLVPNEIEAQLLTGEADPADAAAALVGLGCRAVVVTLGERGALLLESTVPSEALIVPPFSVVAVDTTAAGDAFCGALAASLAYRGELGKGVLLAAAQRAAAAGALAVTVVGALPSLPGVREVDRLVDRGIPCH